MSTPMYPWLRSRMRGGRPKIFRAAFTPATKPWTAASSYPEEPLNWPAP